jgi:hypothetical protein
LPEPDGPIRTTSESSGMVSVMVKAVARMKSGEKE